LLLQGKIANRIDSYDNVQVFVAKLRLWHRQVRNGNAASFPELDAARGKEQIAREGELKNEVEAHLRLLK